MLPVGLLGLEIDIIGAFFLAKSFIRKSPQDIVVEASTYVGYNGAQLKSIVEQQIEAWIGFVLLTLGFIGQSMPYFGMEYRISGAVDVVELLGLGILVLVCALAVRKQLAKWRFWSVGKIIVTREIKSYLDGQPNNTSFLSRHLDRYLQVLGLKRLPGETDEEVLTRILRVCGLSQE